MRVAATSKVFTSTMLLLLIVGN